jgi:glutathione S-transferase
MPSSILVTIPFSHYCEKARWALQRAEIHFEERGHLPGFNRLFTRPHGATTVPVWLHEGGVYRDSTEIALRADALAQAGRKLLPDDPALREQALSLDARFGRRLGVATRAWAYSFLLEEPALIARLASQRVPRLEALAVRPLRGVITTMIRKGLRIGPTTRAWAEQRIEEDFAHVAERLAAGDGAHLVGGSFSLADLTFASLAAPAVLPPEYDGPMPTRDELPGPMRAQIDRWRDSAAGRFALRVFQAHRRARR